MRRLVLALLFALLPGLALAQNYSATAGSGLTFGAKNITSVLYPQFLVCDPTTPSQCAVVSASGLLSVTATLAAETTKVIGTVNQGTSPWVTSGTVTSNQGTAAAVANSWYAKLSDGTNGPAAVKAASTAPTATDLALVVSLSPNSAGIVSPSSTTGNIAANNTTAVVLKASAGVLYGVQLAGLGSAPAYLKIYNAASATCGSGTPVKRLMIPAASTAANGAGSNITFGPQGVNFGTGITYCVTTGILDTDTNAPAASTFLVNVDWS